MDENSTLNDLARKLEQSKERDLKQVQRIEEEKLSELSQRLHERLNKELNTIEEDMTTRLYNFKEELTKARSTIVKQENELMQEIKGQRIEIIGEIEDLNHRLSKIKSKQWIIPTVIGISIVAGLAIGSWSLGAYTTHQLQTLAEIREAQKAIKSYKPVLKVWGNGIEIKKGYQAKLEKTNEGTYFLRLEE